VSSPGQAGPPTLIGVKPIVTRPAMADERRRSRRPPGRAARPGAPPAQGPPWRRFASYAMPHVLNPRGVVPGDIGEQHALHISSQHINTNTGHTPRSALTGHREQPCRETAAGASGWFPDSPG